MGPILFLINVEIKGARKLQCTRFDIAKGSDSDILHCRLFNVTLILENPQELGRKKNKPKEKSELVLGSF